MKKVIYTLLLAISCMQVHAQQLNRNNFGKVDEYVASLGPMNGYYLKNIVDTLTHRRTAKPEDMVRALYVWEAQNIEYNTNGHHHPKQNNTTASYALNERKATHEGYANLFKAMCDMAQIKCVVIPGLAKTNSRDIGEVDPKKNAHTWNAVEIKGTWYLMDLTWGAGTTDRKVKFFTKEYTDAWFATNRELFALNHFPDDKKWQMLDTPINKSNFTFAPIVGTSAIVNEVYPAEGVRGNLRSKSDTTKRMVFEVGNPELIKSVSAKVKSPKLVPVNYKIENNMMYVDMPTTWQGGYDVTLYVNDKMAYIYTAEVSKGKPKPDPKVAEKKAAAAAKAKEKIAADKEKAMAKKVAEKAKQLADKEKALAKKEEEKAKALATKEKMAAQKEAERLKAIAKKEEAAAKAEAAKLKAAEKVKEEKEKAEAKVAAKKEREEAEKEKAAAKAEAKQQREKEEAVKEEKAEKKKQKKDKKKKED
jgi:Uncharacterized protein involved in cytokinesis, contains TGc (transglutaminase/protease-like) domain